MPPMFVGIIEIEMRQFAQYDHIAVVPTLQIVVMHWWTSYQPVGDGL
jgi:hypothetical protein